MAYTKQQLEALKNSLLASGQPINAVTHRALVQKLIDELYDAQSRGDLLAGVQGTNDSAAGDVTLVIRSGQAYLIPTANLVAAGLSFDDINGVVIVDPQNGQLLSYDAVEGAWKNVPNIYIPYDGATANVDLGEFGIKAGFFQLDTTPTNTPEEAGVIFWDADDLTVDVRLNGYVMKIGEDLFYPVKNQTGANIAKGTAVRFAGTLGASARLLIEPFLADGSLESQVFMGVAAEPIADGADGKVLWFGRIRQIDTSAFSEGDILYASPTTAGGFTASKPAAPNNVISVAAVINSDANKGVIFVRPQIIDAAAGVTAINAGAGIQVNPDPTAATPQVSLTGQALSLHSVGGTGFIYRASGVVGTRALQAGPGINIQNGDGVAGAPVISADIAQATGTFTPALSSTNGNSSYTLSVAQGQYVKTGRLVQFSLLITVASSTVPGSDPGCLQITGLPFPSTSIGAAKSNHVLVGEFLGLASGEAEKVTAGIFDTQTKIVFSTVDSVTCLECPDLAASSRIQITGTYIAAT